MSKENEKTLTLEERFAHLEQIVARMEDADVSLDEAFELYKNCQLYTSDAADD